VTYINSRGRRVSAESAYLTPNVLNRPNLKVAIHAQVTRILFDTTGDKPKAVGVEFANAGDGPRFQSRAKKEVIVWCVQTYHSRDRMFIIVSSAGAIHTPQVTKKKTLYHVVSPERFILDIDAVRSRSRKAACDTFDPSCSRPIWCWRPSNGPRLCRHSLPRQVRRRTQLYAKVFWREVRLAMDAMEMENFRNRTSEFKCKKSSILLLLFFMFGHSRQRKELLSCGRLIRGSSQPMILRQ
jgi:GMC oxidoreductase